MKVVDSKFNFYTNYFPSKYIQNVSIIIDFSLGIVRDVINFCDGKKQNSKQIDQIQELFKYDNSKYYPGGAQTLFVSTFPTDLDDFPWIAVKP